MRTIPLVAIALILVTPAALAQDTVNPAPAGASTPAATAARSARGTTPTATSPPGARSAALPANSGEATYDEGTAQRIKDAALSYSDLAVRGGWPTLPPDAKFVPGEPGPMVDLLRRRLLISGDLEANSPSGGPYDDALAEGVRRFQSRHGLAPTGTVTPRTLAALNVPVQRRIRQLEASLERLTELNFSFGRRYVVVNIPAAFAEAVENDHVVRRYRVIVGKTEKPSPTLTAEITSVILNPTWTVPSSITKTEISAHMRSDPGYLARMHMEVFNAHDMPVDPRSVDWSGAQTPNFTVRQQSGRWNALGAVKIDMPNGYAVYMHDTNQRNLFNDDYRFDSHGCARVDQVRDLAAWLLQEELPTWSRAAIDAAIATGERLDIPLPSKVPVAWVYLTAWMTKDQTIQFRNDVYDQDEQLLEATAEEAAFFSEAAGHPLTAHLAQ